ncbi:MAG: hypothetical protein FJX60_15685 [Alphaproteobacteria bacterium]|nr:hypothetical protein [Alphaproteobacteria bacterium]
MPVTNTAAFGQVPNISSAVLTTAKTTPLSGSSNVVLLFTPGANGSLVNGIAAFPRATCTAATVAIYTSTDNGTTNNLVAIGAMAAWTFASTTAPTPLSLTHLDGSIISPTNPLYLPSGTKLYASTGVTQDMVVTANGTDL